jgi:RNA polymerase-binding protein DksA
VAKKTTRKPKPATRSVVKTGIKPKAAKRPAKSAKPARAVKPTKPVKAVKPSSKATVPPFARPSGFGVKPVAAKAAPAEEAAAGALTDEQLRKVKTGLTRKDLDHYRDLLMHKRAEILGDVASLETDAKNNGGNLSNMPLHMADIGSDNYEQEFTLGLVESERKLLQEINEALLRIKAGTYGFCVEMGVPITKSRLDAKPWAKQCIEAARQLERGGHV